jgi:hypothetical protein
VQLLTKVKHIEHLDDVIPMPRRGIGEERHRIDPQQMKSQSDLPFGIEQKSALPPARRHELDRHRQQPIEKRRRIGTQHPHPTPRRRIKDPRPRPHRPDLIVHHRRRGERLTHPKPKTPHQAMLDEGTRFGQLLIAIQGFSC